MRRRAERKNRTLDCVFMELWPFETENSRFCDIVVCALNSKTVQGTFMKLHKNINQHRRHAEHKNHNSCIYTF